MVLDIETFALDEAADFIEEPSAPANYKDETKIAAYITDAKAKAVSRCALDPDLCRIVAIGVSDDAGTHVEIAPNVDQERVALSLAWLALARHQWAIGFNLLSFDLPVMIRRSQYLGVEIPQCAFNLDKYRTAHIDLMERLSFNGKIKAHSLSFYCRRFGIAVDDDTTGKDVDALVRAGDWEAVSAHCRSDVLKTRLLAERLGYVASAVEVA
jgi:hypothetical protein